MSSEAKLTRRTSDETRHGDLHLEWNRVGRTSRARLRHQAWAGTLFIEENLSYS